MGNARGTGSIKTCADSMENYQASLEAGLEELRQEAGRRRGEEMREEGLVCGGPERTGCLVLFQGQGCSTQPARRKRKEGRQGGVCRENMFLWLRKEDCWKGRGALGPGESNSISWPHSLSPVLLPCSSLSLLLASSVVPHFLRATMVFVRN